MSVSARRTPLFLPWPWRGVACCAVLRAARSLYCLRSRLIVDRSISRHPTERPPEPVAAHNCASLAMLCTCACTIGNLHAWLTLQQRMHPPLPTPPTRDPSTGCLIWLCAALCRSLQWLSAAQPSCTQDERRVSRRTQQTHTHTQRRNLMRHRMTRRVRSELSPHPPVTTSAPAPIAATHRSRHRPNRFTTVTTSRHDTTSTIRQSRHRHDHR